MKPQKFRWSKVYESSEEELVNFLQDRNITAERWDGDELQVFDTKQAATNITLWCAEGSLSISIDGTAISMQPGDGLHIPAGARYDMNAGISGCMCYESDHKQL